MTPHKTLNDTAISLITPHISRHTLMGAEFFDNLKYPIHDRTTLAKQMGASKIEEDDKAFLLSLCEAFEPQDFSLTSPQNAFDKIYHRPDARGLGGRNIVQPVLPPVLPSDPTPPPQAGASFPDDYCGRAVQVKWNEFVRTAPAILITNASFREYENVYYRCKASMDYHVERGSFDVSCGDIAKSHYASCYVDQYLAGGDLSGCLRSALLRAQIACRLRSEGPITAPPVRGGAPGLFGTP